MKKKGGEGQGILKNIILMGDEKVKRKKKCKRGQGYSR